MDNLLELQNIGFDYDDQKYHLVMVGLKGDMPFLSKTSHLNRHWLRAARKAAPDKEPWGVCWLCNAGNWSGGPYEDFNWNSQWARVPNTAPWGEEPSFLKLYHSPSSPESMILPDIWHCYHGGAGKNFIASALAECLNLFEGSKDVRVECMANELREWSQLTKNPKPHSGQFCAERIGLTSYAVLPEASWSKFNDTYIYHKFVEWLLEKYAADCAHVFGLESIRYATQQINLAFKILYSSGLWLTQDEALAAGKAGRSWLLTYGQLAWDFFQAGKLRFSIVVKHHTLDHIWRRLVVGASKSPWTPNPLRDSVQMDEDFIGHCARLSRRISARTTPLRLCQRYLVRAHKVWNKMDKKKPQFQTHLPKASSVARAKWPADQVPDGKKNGLLWNGNQSMLTYVDYKWILQCPKQTITFEYIKTLKTPKPVAAKFKGQGRLATKFWTLEIQVYIYIYTLTHTMEAPAKPGVLLGFYGISYHN